MARSIKSRSAPELNLVNRYLLSAYLKRPVVSVRGDDEEEALQDEAHPLVPLGAVNSLSNRESQPLIWPKFTKATSVQLYKNSSSHMVERVFRPLLQGLLGLLGRRTEVITSVGGATREKRTASRLRGGPRHSAPLNRKVGR